MEIRLNNDDIHDAIRGYLRERNIVDSHTNINIKIAVSRGTNPGASADINILGDAEEVTDTDSEVDTSDKKPLFSD